MTDKRRDNKGRVLRNGEVQRADGMYMFRYTDAGGTRRSVYSWRLVGTDKAPEGKRSGEPLRDQEKRILRDLDDGIRADTASRTSVNDLFDSFLSVRTDLRQTTRRNYIVLYNAHVRQTLGSKRVRNVKHSDLQKLYLQLGANGLTVGTIHVIHAILHQLFSIAVTDCIIRADPTANAMSVIKRGRFQKQQKRKALTRDEQDRLITFVYQSVPYRKWGNLITVLLGTGMRIGEATGLRWRDCDFENNTISVNHTLIYGGAPGEKCRHRISAPKTNAAIRTIPMLTEVRRALEREKAESMVSVPKRCVIDGCDDFVFINNNGRPHLESCVDVAMHNLVDAHNRAEEALAKEEQRNPLYLPYFSPHILRHTFCTRLCECESNLKTIQEVMGHTSISITMDVYGEATKEKKEADFSKLETTIRLV